MASQPTITVKLDSKEVVAAFKKYAAKLKESEKRIRALEEKTK